MTRPAGIVDYGCLAEANRTQPRKRVAADVLLRDGNDRVLLVNPSYKDHWDLPGGMAEANESPRQAAKRELQEELDLHPRLGRALVIDWQGPHDPFDDELLFIFDGGRLPRRAVDSLHIADDELTAFAFVPLSQAKPLLRPDMFDRLLRSREALAHGATFYMEGPG